MRSAADEMRAVILQTLGADPGPIEPGVWHRFSTNGKPGDKAGCCRVFDDLRGGVYSCHRQFPGQMFTWSCTDRTAMTRAERAALARQVAAAAVERGREQRQRWACNADRIAKLRAELRPLVRDDPVTLYVHRRLAEQVWPLPAVLMHHPALPYWDDGKLLGTFPAMAAPLVAPNGRTVAWHCTVLTEDGRKANVPTVKKLTVTAGVLAGACIPLHMPVAGVLGIAEGIETALAAWRASGVPTVAAYCAGNLAAWRWPANVQRLVIFADHDKAGAAAAQSLKARAMRAGLSVSVMTPTTPGADWCDVWAQRAAVAGTASEAAA